MSTLIGQAVENAVATHLSRKGHSIIAQNWRTRWCEIDIVTEKEHVVYFVEVKFRSSPNQGEGADYVMPKKLSQMTKAAWSWMQTHRYTGDARLLVASVTKAPARIKLIEVL